MKYRIQLSKEADKVVAKIKKSNPIAFKKYAALLNELGEHPRTGRGHPHPLVAGNDITYSRHLSANDRIIYDIYDDIVMVMILSIEGHYNDK
jgi:toxin YoeB